MKALGKKKQTPGTYKVEITEGEMDFLLTVLSTVSGDPEASPRKYADRLQKGLSKLAGYDAGDADAYVLLEDGRDELNFRNYGTEEPAQGSVDWYNDFFNAALGQKRPTGTPPAPTASYGAPDHDLREWAHRRAEDLRSQGLPVNYVGEDGKPDTRAELSRRVMDGHVKALLRELGQSDRQVIIVVDPSS